MTLLWRCWLAGLILAGGLSRPCLAAPAPTSQLPPFSVYIGTYTGAKSQGIYVVRFDPATGRLGVPELAAKTTNPSFLAAHPNRRFLYAAGEMGEAGGKPAGMVSAFRIAADTGKLALINQQSSGGAGPCYITLDRTGKWALTANYVSGSIAVLPVRRDGSLGAATAIVQHRGSSVDPQRQRAPHAHFITPAPAGRFVLALILALFRRRGEKHCGMPTFLHFFALAC